jgi:hypothetical protein
MKQIKMFFKGGLGIEHPTDADGKIIKEGDIITFNYFDTEGAEIHENWVKEYRPNKMIVL